MINFKLFIFVSLFFLPLAKSQDRQPRAQIGVVKYSGTAVYEDRSFDAPVMTYLEAQKKVIISRQKYKGYGDFGLFYKVRIKKGVYGYVADTDVIPQFEKRPGTKRPKANPVFKKVQKPQKVRDQTKISETRWVGGSFGRVNMSEKFAQRVLSSPTNVFGFQISGPRSLVEFLATDLEFLMSLSPPEYYSKDLKSDSLSGMFFMANLGLTLPLLERNKFPRLFWSGPFHGLYTL